MFYYCTALGDLLLMLLPPALRTMQSLLLQPGSTEHMFGKTILLSYSTKTAKCGLRMRFPAGSFSVRDPAWTPGESFQLGQSLGMVCEAKSFQGLLIDLIPLRTFSFIFNKCYI